MSYRALLPAALQSPDTGSIRLDIYADDELQVHYNVETQNETIACKEK